jgi:hypothetical protein
MVDVMVKHKRSNCLKTGLGILAFGCIGCLGGIVYLIIGGAILSLNTSPYSQAVDLLAKESITPGESLNLRLVHQLGGDASLLASRIYRDGTKAIVMDEWNDGLYILDVLEPISPAVSTFYKPFDYFYSHDVEVQDDYVFLAPDGLEIISISNPSMPTVAGRYDTQDSIRNIAVAGERVYLASQDSFYIIDISDPTKPESLGYYQNLDGIEYIEDIAVVRNYLYIIGQGVYIFDVSDPINPVQSGFFDPPPSRIRDKEITVVEDIAFLMESYKLPFDPIIVSQLLLLDISNPLKPVEIVSYEWSEYWRIGGFALDFIYRVGKDGLRLLDFSDPEAPIELGFYGLRCWGHYSSEAAIGDGNIIYMVDESGGLHVLEYIPPVSISSFTK